MWKRNCEESFLRGDKEKKLELTKKSQRFLDGKVISLSTFPVPHIDPKSSLYLFFYLFRESVRRGYFFLDQTTRNHPKIIPASTLRHLPQRLHLSFQRQLWLSFVYIDLLGHLRKVRSRQSQYVFESPIEPQRRGCQRFVSQR